MKLLLRVLVILVAVIILGSLAGCSETAPSVKITETIGIVDSPGVTHAVEINVDETIGINDSPQTSASLMTTVMEPIFIADSVRIILPVEIRIIETIRVVDTNVVQPVQALPVINYFLANPTRIFKGGSSTLNWGVSGATKITIDQKIGSVAAQGSIKVYPTQTTTYTLTASNTGGSVTATVTVTVIKLHF
jgi:hypothetical protein